MKKFTLLAILVMAAIPAFAEDEEGFSPVDEAPTAAKAGDKSPAGKREEGGFVIEKRGGKTIKYKKKTTYDFEGANIDGMYNKPSGSYISNIKDVKAKSILRIRENFDAEVLDSSRLVK